jgi:hypothetical protein
VNTDEHNSGAAAVMTIPVTERDREQADQLWERIRNEPPDRIREILAHALAEERARCLEKVQVACIQ